MPFSATSIVATVWEARKSKLPEDMICAQLGRMGLTPEQTTHVLEMIELSQNRAFMETFGGSHSADFDDDPYFKASLLRARRDFPSSPSGRRKRLITRSVVGAAILVGLIAISVVAYYMIDLWRASH